MLCASRPFGAVLQVLFLIPKPRLQAGTGRALLPQGAPKNTKMPSKEVPAFTSWLWLSCFHLCWNHTLRATAMCGLGAGIIGICLLGVQLAVLEEGWVSLGFVLLELSWVCWRRVGCHWDLSSWCSLGLPSPRPMNHSCCQMCAHLEDEYRCSLQSVFPLCVPHCALGFPALQEQDSPPVEQTLCLE